MTTSPVVHQLPGCPGGDVSSKKLTVKVKRGLLALKFYMEMWRIMIAKIHSNNNSEKRGNDRHGFLLSD